MRIFRYNGKLAKETSFTEGNKVVFFRYLEDEDKEKCPHCNKPLDTELSIVEGCPNWDDDVEAVETISRDKNKG